MPYPPMKDLTQRRGNRWTKISGQRGAYTVALGWRGDFKATRVQRAASRIHAGCIANNWLAEANV